MNDSTDYPDTDSLSVQGVASSSECTGLVPTLPIESDEIEAYTDIYDIPEQGGLEELESVVESES